MRRPDFEPPIIRRNRIPAMVRVRDLLLTALMWLILFLILETELGVAVTFVRQLQGVPDAVVDLRLDQFWLRLRPTMLMVAFLLGALLIASLFTVSRQTARRRDPQPPPLSEASLAARAGISAEQLAEAGKLRIVRVMRDPEGRLCIVAAGSPVLKAIGPPGP